MFTIVTVPLLVFAIGWMVWHYRAYRAIQGHGDTSERGFQARRFLRRMQASAMLAVAAVLLFAGQRIDHDDHPAVYVAFWCGVVLWMAWVLALAAADAVANVRRARQLQLEFRRERARLEAEVARQLRRAQEVQREATERNGQAE